MAESPLRGFETRPPAPLGTVLREYAERGAWRCSRCGQTDQYSLIVERDEALAENKLLIEQRETWKQEATGARNDLAAVKAQRDEALAALREIAELCKAALVAARSALSNQEKP